MLINTNLGFHSLWIFTSSSFPHFPPIFSPSVSMLFLLPASIIILPSLSGLSDVIPTFISVGFSFISSSLVISSGDWLSFDQIVSLNFFSTLRTNTLEYSFCGWSRGGTTCLLSVFGCSLSRSLGVSIFPFVLALLLASSCVPNSFDLFFRLAFFVLFLLLTLLSF